MKITEVTVSAGRTFNHPYEEYSNFKPRLSMTATVEIEEAETAEEVIHFLQLKAETLMEEHKRSILESIRNKHCIREIPEARRQTLNETIERAQQELKTMDEPPSEYDQIPF